MAELVTVANTKDLSNGKAIAVNVAGKKIAIFNTGGKYYAIDDECSHAGGPLAEGELSGTIVTCPWHGATFEITTGEALGAPAFVGVPAYPVRIEGEDVKIEL